VQQAFQQRVWEVAASLAQGPAQDRYLRFFSVSRVFSLAHESAFMALAYRAGRKGSIYIN
jgi:hypothetical protein